MHQHIGLIRGEAVRSRGRDRELTTTVNSKKAVNGSERFPEALVLFGS
jgi:hypothetical protein